MRVTQHVHVLVVIIYLFVPLQTATTAQCRVSLGMQSGEIPDWAITASSAYDWDTVGPASARIRTEQNGGAWCPKQQVSKDSYEWLQIDLQELKVISQVETQGRFGNGQGHEFADHYRLEYQREEGGAWFRYQNGRGEEIFQGNNNTYTAQLREVDPPVIARKVRFVPYSDHPRTVCMRLEVYGCTWTDENDPFLNGAGIVGPSCSAIMIAATGLVFWMTTA